MFKQNKFYRSAVVLLVITVLTVSGCARFKAPNKKLDRSIYSPEGTMLTEGQYTVGVRDELEVFVWRCPELDTTAIVRPEDGKITLPLIGDVRAVGLTPKDLAKSISDKMAYYVKEPRVAVGVKKFGDKKVFVLGEVRVQGTYRLDRGDRIIDLIAKANGFSDGALPSCTYVIRGGYDDPKMIRVNLNRFIHRADTSQNIYLAEGDMVYVPRSEIENLNYALRKIFPSMYFAEQLAEIQGDIMAGRWDWAMVWRKMAGN